MNRTGTEEKEGPLRIEKNNARPPGAHATLTPEQQDSTACVAEVSGS